MRRANMRKMISGGLLAGTMLLALGACGKKDAAAGLEKGQVIATVDGKDITIHELNAELQGIQMPTGEARKIIEQNALQQIINRRILSDIARERGLDKTPAYLLQERRADDQILVDMLQRSIASTIPQPTKSEAQKFMDDNPEMFAQRKIFTVDQIQFELPADEAKLKAFQPLKTMEEVQAKLDADHLQYKRAPGQMDALRMPPQLLQQILKLPAGEVFIIPVPGRPILVANKIVETKVVPFTGDQALAAAMQQVQMRKLNDLANKELEGKVKAARDAVKYQPGYGPAKPGAPTPAASGSPAASASPAAK
ncbi:MAG: peptidyl-prolyl cis-trans isomerase, EpsD family [Sphingomonas sanxanigenens]|uniref:Peptidyl-prolyl cis-trans isomerase, EpsD family n=1 Tax=Sphingomonas sanxanigenens TaxID=397260 RepID=A0A2W5AAS8_9SPHN|nr:MAG: peptidyl-prolyl cis-trans isomerase, EpsD family [Sphingomonas sanxanigenens]